jgi:hypothetical protein
MSGQAVQSPQCRRAVLSPEQKRGEPLLLAEAHHASTFATT